MCCSAGMEDGRVTNIVAALAPAITKGEQGSAMDSNPLVLKLEANGGSVEVMALKIPKSDAHIPGFSSKISSVEKLLQKQLTYSQMIQLTHDLKMQFTWMDTDTYSKNESLMSFNMVVVKVFEEILQVPKYKVLDNGEVILHYKINSGGDVGSGRENLSRPLCYIETDSSFYSVNIRNGETYSLWDVCVFSPSAMKGSSDKLLFVIYQLISALNFCGSLGYLPSDVRLQSMVLDQNFWLKLDLVRCLLCIRENIDEYSRQTVVSPSTSDRCQSSAVDEACRPLWEWTRMWTECRISNFDYLVALNRFAGRRKDDPNYHPVFPWVVDFSSESGGYCDLSKTKYRSTKGDQQLDQTFCVSPETQRLHAPPHHISEFLSDIGYFTYKSRTTSKDILCKHVRSKWVPEEYPCSIQRLYQWTPDECIPEFYSESSVFKSIHEDLFDLEVPEWSDNVENFIEWHRRMLESENVSVNLHKWIDLVFGYKLSGEAAIEAKNVQYHLNSDQQELKNYGIIQLFERSHPQKKLSTEQDQMKFETVLNPLYDVEIQHGNSSQNADLKPNEETSVQQVWQRLNSDRIRKKVDQGVDMCMKSLVVSLIDMCHPRCMFHLSSSAGLAQRWNLAERHFRTQLATIPRCLRTVLSHLIGNADQRVIEPELITPGFLLQPIAQLIPFPLYHSVLYECLSKMSTLDDQFDMLVTGNDFSAKTLEAMRSLKENKVRTLVKTLPLTLPQMSLDAVELMAHFVKDLLSDPWTAATAAWSLFNPMAEALGPQLTLKYFLSSLLDIYDTETPCTAKYVKLYHRTFLLQVIVRLGTKEFLINFILPLIESVAGMRDPLMCKDENQHAKQLVSLSIINDRTNRKDSHLKKERSNADFRISQNSMNFPSDQGRNLLPSSSSALSFNKQQATSDKLNKQQATSNTELEGIQFDLDLTDEHLPHLDKTPDEQVATIAGDERLSFGKSTSDDVISTISSSSLTSSQLVQSETEEDPEIGDVDTQDTVSNKMPLISEVITENIIWLAHRLGPLMTARHLTRNLLRMLALCYGEDKLKPRDSTLGEFPSSIIGDQQAERVLNCLEHIASIYGEQFIVRHYFAYCSDIVQLASKRLNPNVEANLIACIVVVRHLFPYLSDEQLMDNLKDHYFVDNIMYPIVRLVSSSRLLFSSDRARTVLVWKLLDCLHCLGQRAGGENVKNYLFVVLQRLMCTYDIMYVLEDNGVHCRTSAEGESAVINQLRDIFGPELAHLSTATFRQLVGRQYLQLSLPNSELVGKIAEIYQSESNDKGVVMRDMPLTSTSFGAKILSGNRISGVDIATSSSPVIFRRPSLDIYSKRLKHSMRQVKGNWLAYWEHELGRSDRDTNIYFKQMKLMSFVGHTSSIKRIYAMENENSFISASQDKTIKLWSLRSFGDGSSRSNCQYTYKAHNKPLFDMTFVDGIRLVASTDGIIHIWDPFFGSVLREFEFGDGDQHYITITKALASPSKLVLAAGTSPLIKFLDVRQAKWVQEFKLGSHAFGPVRGVCLDPHGMWVAIGHGLGQMSVLDIRTGRFIVSKKIADVDISLMETMPNGSIVVSVPEQPLLVFKMPQCIFSHKLQGPIEAYSCVIPYYNELLCCSQNNRFRVYQSTNSDATYSESKLRSDIFTGNMSTMSVLPLNKLLLFGSSNGSVELLC